MLPRKTELITFVLDDHITIEGDAKRQHFYNYNLWEDLRTETHRKLEKKVQKNESERTNVLVYMKYAIESLMAKIRPYIYITYFRHEGGVKVTISVVANSSDAYKSVSLSIIVVKN